MPDDRRGSPSHHQPSPFAHRSFLLAPPPTQDALPAADEALPGRIVARGPTHAAARNVAIKGFEALVSSNHLCTGSCDTLLALPA